MSLKTILSLFFLSSAVLALPTPRQNVQRSPPIEVLGEPVEFNRTHHGPVRGFGEPVDFNRTRYGPIEVRDEPVDYNHTHHGPIEFLGEPVDFNHTHHDPIEVRDEPVHFNCTHYNPLGVLGELVDFDPMHHCPIEVRGEPIDFNHAQHGPTKVLGEPVEFNHTHHAFNDFVSGSPVDKVTITKREVPSPISTLRLGPGPIVLDPDGLGLGHGPVVNERRSTDDDSSIAEVVAELGVVQDIQSATRNSANKRQSSDDEVIDGPVAPALSFVKRPIKTELSFARVMPTPMTIKRGVERRSDDESLEGFEAILAPFSMIEFSSKTDISVSGATPTSTSTIAKRGVVKDLDDSIASALDAVSRSGEAAMSSVQSSAQAAMTATDDPVNYIIAKRSAASTFVTVVATPAPTLSAGWNATNSSEAAGKGSGRAYGHEPGHEWRQKYDGQDRYDHERHGPFAFGEVVPGNFTRAGNHTRVN